MTRNVSCRSCAKTGPTLQYFPSPMQPCKHGMKPILSHILTTFSGIGIGVAPGAGGAPLKFW